MLPLALALASLHSIEDLRRRWKNTNAPLCTRTCIFECIHCIHANMCMLAHYKQTLHGIRDVAQHVSHPIFEWTM